MRRGVLLAITVATIGGLTGPTAEAQSSEQEFSCIAEVDVELSPGISTSPGSGTITSNGQTGSVSCGQPDPASYGLVGKYGTEGLMSCTSAGGGGGTHTASSAKRSLSEDMTFHVTGMKGGAVSGRIDGKELKGPFKAFVREGDCFSEPVTKVHLTISFETSESQEKAPS